MNTNKKKPKIDWLETVSLEKPDIFTNPMLSMTAISNIYIKCADQIYWQHTKDKSPIGDSGVVIATELAVCQMLYVTALEASINTALGLSLSALKRENRTADFEGLATSIKQDKLVEKIEEILSQHPNPDKKHFDEIVKKIKAINGIRHELIHYKPHMIEIGSIPKSIEPILDYVDIGVVNAAWIKLITTDKVTKWVRNTVVECHDALEPILGIFVNPFNRVEPLDYLRLPRSLDQEEVLNSAQ